MTNFNKVLVCLGIVLALVVSFGVGRSLVNHGPAEPLKFEGITALEKGVLQVNGGIIPGDVKILNKKVRLAANEWYVEFNNNTGKDLFLTDGELSVVATSSLDTGIVPYASSSYRLYLVASSTRHTPDPYIAMLGSVTASSSILTNAFFISTSTHATTTSYRDSLVGSEIGVWRIPDGGSVFGILQTTCPPSAAANLACLTATSSFRGFDVEMRLFLHD